MEHIGMELGEKESQIAIITEAGELVEKRMRTKRDRLMHTSRTGRVQDPDGGLDDQRVGGEALGGAGLRGCSRRSELPPAPMYSPRGVR